MDTRDLIVSSCAIVGALLGVFNLVRTYLTEAERGSVAVIEGSGDEFPGVEVVNRSPFPLTVTELGTVHPDNQMAKVILDLKYHKDNTLPRRVEARDSTFFHIDMHETISRQVHRPTFTFARTALGTVFTTEGYAARYWRRTLEIVRLKERVV